MRCSKVNFDWGWFVAGVLRSVLVAMVLSVGLNGAEAAKRPYTVEDHLALEQIGSATSGPNVVSWAMSPPYRDIGYYGNGNGVWEHAGAGLYIATPSEDLASAVSLFEPEPGVSYLVQSISPDERFIVYCRAQGVEFGVGVYDRQTSMRRSYELMPASGGCEDEFLVWSSSEEFLMLATSGRRPPPSGARPYTGERFADAWERTWKGGLSVDVQDTNTTASGVEAAQVPSLTKVNVRTGAVLAVAQGRFDGLVASPSGRFLAATRSRGERTHDGRCDTGVPADQEVLVFDLRDGGELISLAPELGVVQGTLSWSTTQDRLAFFACGDNDRTFGIYGWDPAWKSLSEFGYEGLDLVSRRERGLYQQPERFVWMGERVAVYARHHGGAEAKFTPRDVRLFVTRDELPRADWYALSSQGKARNLSSHTVNPSPFVLWANEQFMTVVGSDNLWRVSALGEQLQLTDLDQAKLELPMAARFAALLAPLQKHALVIDSGAKPAFLLVDNVTGRVRSVRSPAPTAEYIASAAEAGAVLFRLDDDDGTKIVMARDDGSSKVVRTLNRHLSEVERTTWKTISYEVQVSGSAQKTESCILLPPGFKAGERYPVVVEVYPTRRAHCTDPAWQEFVGFGRSPHSVSAHLLAGHGYIVFQPNAASDLIRSSDGPIGSLTSVVEQGVSQLIRRGLADQDRVGLIGFSQGGLASLWVASQSSMFGATVSLNGWSDLYTNFYDSTYYQAFYPDQFGFDGQMSRYLPSVGGAFAMGKSPQEDAQAYVSASPIQHADRISGPVLLIHSDMDMFPLHQYERMYAALRHYGKRGRMLRYWGEGHAPSSPENIRHMWQQIFSWYDEHLRRMGSGSFSNR